MVPSLAEKESSEPVPSLAEKEWWLGRFPRARARGSPMLRSRGVFPPVSAEFPAETPIGSPMDAGAL